MAHADGSGQPGAHQRLERSLEVLLQGDLGHGVTGAGIAKGRSRHRQHFRLARVGRRQALCGLQVGGQDGVARVSLVPPGSDARGVGEQVAQRYRMLGILATGRQFPRRQIRIDIGIQIDRARLLHAPCGQDRGGLGQRPGLEQAAAGGGCAVGLLSAPRRAPVQRAGPDHRHGERRHAMFGHARLHGCRRRLTAEHHARQQTLGDPVLPRLRIRRGKARLG
nr:hypothetical protein [Pseudoxanthomonas mexicana]